MTLLSRRLHVTGMRQIRKAYRILEDKPLGKIDT
jgi:hypothetical protein